MVNNTPTAKKKEKIDTPLTQVVRGAEQLKDEELKERIRFYVPSLIERLIDLCNSNNQAISLGATKYALGKVLPDLKATEVEGNLTMEIQNVIQSPSKRPLETPPETD